MEVLSMGEIIDRLALAHSLPADHPDSPTGFARNSDDNGWDIYWGGYGYWLTDADLRTPAQLFHWIDHLGGKNWKGMTGQRLAKFIGACRARMEVAS